MSDAPKSAREYLASIGARGGAAKSAAKKETAKANGKKGGRPPGSKDSQPRERRWKVKPDEPAG